MTVKQDRFSLPGHSGVKNKIVNSRCFDDTAFLISIVHFCFR
jgi:hypothetical protein